MNIHDVQKRLSLPRYFEAVMAIGLKGEIGQQGRMPWECEGYSMRRDLKRFMDLTLDRVVVMGRKTWESLPGPLKRRTFIILTQEPIKEPVYRAWPNKAVSWTMNFDQLGGVLEKHYPEEDTIMIAGGSEIYRLFYPVIGKYHITQVEKEFPNADTFSYPPIGLDGWRLISEEAVVEGEVGRGLMTHHLTYAHSARNKVIASCRTRKARMLNSQ